MHALGMIMHYLRAQSVPLSLPVIGLRLGGYQSAPADAQSPPPGPLMAGSGNERICSAGKDFASLLEFGQVGPDLNRLFVVPATVMLALDLRRLFHTGRSFPVLRATRSCSVISRPLLSRFLSLPAIHSLNCNRLP